MLQVVKPQVPPSAAFVLGISIKCLVSERSWCCNYLKPQVPPSATLCTRNSIKCLVSE